jgi:hypothetical protein
MKKMKQMARQGDVLIIRKGCTTLKADTAARLFNTTSPKVFDYKQEKRLPLAYGEVSGHAHALHEVDKAELTYSNDIQETLKHLKVKEETAVTHQEHAGISIPVGDNAVLIQNEYILGEIRRTMD